MSGEFEVLQSIYPELVIDGCEALLDIPISFEDIRFLAFHTYPRLEVRHLPPVELSLKIVAGYPITTCPVVSLHCPWLNDKQIELLIEECEGLWVPGEEVLFSIVDHIRTSCIASFAFDGSWPTILADDLYHLLREHEQFALRSEFNEKSFECQICLDWRSGQACIAMDCGHTFCLECLKSMFGLYIHEGSVQFVRCPSCPQPSNKDGEGQLCKSPARFPGTLLRQIVSSNEVERYNQLIHKKELEALPSSTHCPRDFCGTILGRNPDEKLVVCTSCQYAFCADCKKTWHGPLEPCKRLKYSSTLGSLYNSLCSDSSRVKERVAMERLYGKRNLSKLLKELADEQLVDQWRSENAQACPSCNIFVEKSQGCNHMICSICQTHFCFLCGEGLSSRNPYSHYSDKGVSCYGKLFEGLTGLEDPYAGF